MLILKTRVEVFATVLLLTINLSSYIYFVYAASMSSKSSHAMALSALIFILLCTYMRTCRPALSAPQELDKNNGIPTTRSQCFGIQTLALLTIDKTVTLVTLLNLEPVFY